MSTNVLQELVQYTTATVSESFGICFQQ